jgi:3-oxoacyl-[acyl-carrier-protein] synthase-3
MGRHAAITGWGMAVPETILSNADLERLVDTSDEWIVSRTGIRERRVIGPGESSTSLAVAAARQALDRAGLEADAVDLIIAATYTPDKFMVSQACLVQAELGGTAAAFDLGAACSGFVYALATGAQFIQSGLHRRVLVIGVDTQTRFVDYTDRATCVLFGDGAGAVVLEATDQPVGLLSTVLGADGSGYRHLYVPGWEDPAGSTEPPISPVLSTEDNGTERMATLGGAPSAPPRSTSGGTTVAAPRAIARQVLSERPHVRMNGNEVFRFAVRVMGEAAVEAVEKAGLSFADVDMLIPHQANLRIIDAAARRLDLPRDRVWVNVDRYGNTSSASIPIALCEAEAAGRLHAGDNVVLVAFGGGLSWAAGVVRWGATGVDRLGEAVAHD